MIETAQGERGPADAAGLAAAIRRDLSRLADLASGAAATADLQAALAALARIEAAALSSAGGSDDALAGVLDPAPIRRLLHLAGDRDGAELMRRLDSDLAAAARRLEGAVPDGPAEDIRAATHVLVSLAGSVGGRTTETLARALNSAVHDGARPETLAQEAARLLTAVKDLRRALAGPLDRPAGPEGPRG